MSRNDTKPLTNGHGNGSHGPITRADLEAKLRDITGDVSDTVDAARGTAVKCGAAETVDGQASGFFPARPSSSRTTTSRLPCSTR